MSERQHRNLRAEHAFTLIELLVVIVILGILSAVVVFAVRGSSDKGYAAAVEADARMIRSAEEAYCARHGRYVPIGDVGQAGTLVGDRFLSTPSQYNELILTTSGGPCGGYGYEIKEQPQGSGASSTTTTTTTLPPSTPAASTWTVLPPGATPRYSPAMAEFPPTNSLVMFGGTGPGPAGSGVSTASAGLGDTWVWTGAWVLVAPGDSAGCPDNRRTLSPCPRRAPLMAYDAARGEAILVGGVWAGSPGIGGSKMMDDTWRWNGLSWTYAGAGPQVTHGSMAYDPIRRKVVLFGGRTPGATTEVYSEGTWLWDGFVWEKAPSGPSPSARHAASMAFDPISERMILFGGTYGDSNQDLYFDETWAWDGTSWAQLTPATKPGRRMNASMASDSATRLMLFGGDNVGAKGGTLPCCYYNDTWEWDGLRSSWVKRKPSVSPPGQTQAGFAYHRATNQFVMFGGGNNIVASTDTWGYTSPPPVSGPSPPGVP